MSCVKGVTRFTGILLVMLAVSAAGVPASTPREIPLWPNGAPGSEGKPAKEDVTTSASGELRVAGIHNPTITPYLPAKEIATGLAILVIPGGGHRMLAITHEGYNVAEWFQAHGIAAFVLKHRLAREPNSTYRIEVESLSDTKRAIRLIRARAKEWNIDPARVGAPPVFLAAAYDDRQDISEGLAEAYLRFKRAGVPAELHIYGTGGHGFGLRQANKRPVGQWMVRFEEWLTESGFLRRP